MTSYQYIIIIVTVLNHIAFRGSKVLISLYAMQLGADPFIVGVIISLYSLLPLFFAVHAGRLSDRFGPRIPMLLGSIGLAGGLLLPFLLPRLATLYVSATMIGAFYIFYSVAVQHLIGTFGSGAQRTSNYSTFSLGIALSALFGPTLAGFSIDLAGYELTYLFLSFLPAAPALFIMFFASALPHMAAEDRQARQPMMDLVRDVPLRRALVIAGIIETGLELFNFYMPIYGHSLGLSASLIGVIMGVYAIAQLLMRGVMPVLVRRSSEEGVLFGSLSLAAVAFFLFPFVASAYLLIAIAFLLGIGLGCGSPLSLIITYNRAPKGRHGEAMGLRQSVNKFIQVLVPVIVGTLGSALGVSPAFWMDALLLSAGAFIMRADARSRVRAKGREQAGVAR
jgi:MFS family permease